MRLPHTHRHKGVDFNMTPMIDVVFLLIIFFLVSSHLARQEAQMALPLPEADSGQRFPADEAPRVTINVLGDGSLMWAGREVAAESLRDRLARKLGRDGQDLEVRIRADRNVAYRNVEPILLACAHAGIWNVTFASYRPEETP